MDAIVKILNGLVGLVITFFVIVILLCVWLFHVFFSKTEIRSTNLIQPQIELVIENNKVDTIYVYVEP